MWESPVNVIMGEIQTQIEGDIYKAIQNVGIDVNKEELIKAMQYDRNQYEKGYKDGYADAIDECIKVIEETVWRDTAMLVENIRSLKGGGNSED